MAIEPDSKLYYAVAEIATGRVVKTTGSEWLAAEAMSLGTCWASGATAKAAKKAAKRSAAQFRETLGIEKQEVDHAPLSEPTD